MINLKCIATALILSLAALAHASDEYKLANGASILAPTNMTWKKYEQEDNEISLTNQTDTPPYHTSFLTLKISPIDSGVNRIEHIIEGTGKRLSRFSLNENNRELLINFSYKREDFLGMDCISSSWETVHPRKNEDNTIYRIVKMIECPHPKSTNDIISLSFAYSGKKSSIRIAMHEDAEKFFNSLTLSSASKR